MVTAWSLQDAQGKGTRETGIIFCNRRGKLGKIIPSPFFPAGNLDRLERLNVPTVVMPSYRESDPADLPPPAPQLAATSPRYATSTRSSFCSSAGFPSTT